MKITKSKIIFTVALTGLLFSGTAAAKGRYAKVVEATPIYRYHTISTPREVCQAPVSYKRQRADGAVVGAVLGGTFGHAIAKNSRNRDAATMAGVLIGGVLGHEMTSERGSRSDRYSNRQQQYCMTRYEHEKKVRQLEGFDVTYRYRGTYYQTFMQEHPGKRVYVGGARRAKHGHKNQHKYRSFRYNSEPSFHH